MPGPPGKNVVGIITEYREGRVVPMRRILENDHTSRPSSVVYGMQPGGTYGQKRREA